MSLARAMPVFATRLPTAVLLTGVAASAAGHAVALIFALAAVAGFGMLHGISDLAIIPKEERGGFLIVYVAVVAGVLAWWRVSPSTALASFLLLSALHFGMEDAPAGRPAERMCRGLLMVAGPALLHGSAIAALLAGLVPLETATALARVMGLAAMAGLALLPLALVERREQSRSGNALLLGGIGAAILLPPLAGFATAFVVLHAEPELLERRSALKSRSLADYTYACRHVAIGATLVLATAGWLLAGHAALPLALLFAGVAALAIPHMVVTPLWVGGTAGQPFLRQVRQALQTREFRQPCMVSKPVEHTYLFESPERADRSN